MQLIAHTEFAGGAMRPVYEDERSQFVIDDYGERIDGVWLIARDECDEPIVVDDGGPGDDF